ncbi:MAG: hypothetical protein QOI54_3308 [Actinomycetota bacterium]|jgi:hypothetical protein|nr:hypothetical protein [Actinomycetota bacterium]
MSTATDVPFEAPTGSYTFQVTDVPDIEVDPEEVARIAIYATRGWTREDKNGRIVPDDEAAKNFVYAYMRDNVVVNSESDIVDDGVSDADIYAKTFPRTPGATAEPVDDAQFSAYKTVLRKLWQYAGTSIRAHCQETAEMEGLDYVMCEKKVYRASRDVSTGTGAPKQVNVRFFTSNADLIFQLSSQPAAAKLVKVAEETAKHLLMNTTRHPELASRVAKETQLAMKRSAASLAPVTSAKKATADASDGDDNSDN